MIPKLVRTTNENIKALFAIDDDVTVLDAQPIEFSFDQLAWITGEWIGTVGSERWAKCKVGGGTGLVIPPDRSNATVYARITTNDDQPVLHCGTVEFK